MIIDNTTPTSATGAMTSTSSVTNTLLQAKKPEDAQRLAQIPAQWATPPSELISSLPKGGTQLDYMGHADITLALISIDPFYEYGWLRNDNGSMLIQDKGKRLVLEGWVKVHGHTHHGVGTCEANKFEPEKELIGDLLRNCAMRFGFATTLWSKAEEYDWTTPPEPPTPPTPPKVIDPEVNAAYETMLGLAKSLDASAKVTINSFWADHAGGRPKPTLETATLDDLDALIAEMTRLTLGGELVDNAA